MTIPMTITLGWWIIPTLITLVMLVWSFLKGKSQSPYDLVAPMVWLVAMVVSLTSWLIWALL